MLVISGALAGLLLAPSQQRPAPRRLLVPQRHAVSLMSESIVVTDGTDSFYASRGLFQLLQRVPKFKPPKAEGLLFPRTEKKLRL